MFHANENEFTLVEMHVKAKPIFFDHEWLHAKAYTPFTPTKLG